MEPHERIFLEDTYAILIDYDGYRSVEGLMGLIDETKERISKLLNGKVTPEDVGLKEEIRRLQINRQISNEEVED